MAIYSDCLYLITSNKNENTQKIFNLFIHWHTKRIGILQYYVGFFEGFLFFVGRSITKVNLILNKNKKILQQIIISYAYSSMYIIL